MWELSLLAMRPFQSTSLLSVTPLSRASSVPTKARSHNGSVSKSKIALATRHRRACYHAQHSPRTGSRRIPWITVNPPTAKACTRASSRNWACRSFPGASNRTTNCPLKPCCAKSMRSAARCCAKPRECWSPRAWCIRARAWARWSRLGGSGTCSTRMCCIG